MLFVCNAKCWKGMFDLVQLFPSNTFLRHNVYAFLDENV